MATAIARKERAGQRRKSIEDVVGYAVSHRTRVQLLIILNDGSYCASELAKLIGEPLKNVANHLRELADGGAIEVVEIKRRRNCLQHFYRAITVPVHTKDDLLEMRPQERQITAGLVIQSLVAEMMAAFRTNKIRDDLDHTLLWDRLNIDEQGRSEIGEEQLRHWERLAEIEEESLTRASASGGKTFPYILAVLGFKRGQKTPVVS